MRPIPYLRGMAETTVAIEGMSCDHCVNAVKMLLENMNGVEKAEVSLNTKDAHVLFAETTSEQTIIDTINSSNSYKAKQK